MHRGPRLSTRDPAAFARDIFRNACDTEARWRGRAAFGADRREALAGAYDFVCRQFFDAEPETFARSLERLYAVQPGFRPSWPKIAGAASRVLGTSGAGRLMRLLGRPPQRL